jgi:argininosuccinate synthase
MTREEEIEYAVKNGIPVPTTKASPYSIDDNLWGRAIECGILEDPWAEPPQDIYTMTSDSLGNHCDEPEYAEITFEQGLPIALDGEVMSFHDIVLAMNELAGRHGFGRIDMIENRLVGLKSREIYEVPGALTLIQAHKALEDLCLERDLLHYKLGPEQKWAELVYNGLWFSPLKEAIDGFIESTQQLVTGDIRLRFYKGSCTTVGRRSPYSLYDYDLATYDETDTFDHEAAKGFIDLWSLPTKVWARQRRKVGKEGEV